MGRILLAITCFLFSTSSFAESSYTFTGRDVIAALNIALSGTEAGSDVKVTLPGMREDDVYATASSPIHAQADALMLDKAHARFETTLLLTADGKNLPPLKLSGHYDAMSQVPVLGRRLQAGDIIAREDIEWVEVPTAHVRKTIITDMKELIGKSPRRMISMQRPIRRDEVAGPTLITKGARVTLLFTSGNIEIKTLGETMDSGAKGDVIRVRNLSSKTVVQGTVESSNCVRVSTPDSLSAEAM